MSKPDWKDAPEWAQWLTMEEDGTWYWNENEPREVDHGWHCEGRYECAGIAVPDWKQSKTARPDKENWPHPDGFAGGLTEREEK